MKPVINILLFIVGFFIMVFPNSFQLLTAGLLIFITVLIVFYYKRVIVHRYFVLAWMLLSLIFLFYISISPIELVFKGELVLKYIVFPFLWINIWSYIKLNFSVQRVVKTLFNFSILSLLSVLILYFSMLNGYDYAEYFIVAPNIDSDYLLGFTLHVYGNLIFFAAGLFVLPDVYKSKAVVYLYIITFIIVTLISGRTALLVSLIIGFCIMLIRYVYNFKFGTLAFYIISFFLFLAILTYYTEKNLNYNFFDYLQKGSLAKLKELGGQERTSQSNLIFTQIVSHPWGVGFTNVGIERNEERTFSYEVLVLATVLRFGIIGAACIIFSVYPVMRNFINLKWIGVYNKFYLTGFLSIILFSFTNPYLESFNFQWMFFCPLIFLSGLHSTYTKGETDASKDRHLLKLH